MQTGLTLSGVPPDGCSVTRLMGCGSDHSGWRTQRARVTHNDKARVAGFTTGGSSAH